MWFVFLALGAAADLSALPLPMPDRMVNPATSNCPRPTASEAQRSNAPLRMRHLGELPGADALAAVWRTKNGCTVPVITRHDIGGPAPRWKLPEPQERRTLIRR